MRNQEKIGLLIVYTGQGKGKTTAALGLAMRAWGRNFRVCVLQFLKAETGRWGEVQAAQKMGLEWHKLGRGFVPDENDPAGNQRSAREAWTFSCQKIVSGDYDLIILDEFTYPLHYGWLDPGSVLEWLRSNKPPHLHLVITGRHAPQPLIDEADLVTEMRDIKHPFQRGITARAGIDF